MADESEKKRRAAVADRLKAMFKAAETLPTPERIRSAAAGLDDEEGETPSPHETPRREP